MCYECVVALASALARVINYAPRVTLEIVVSLTDDPRGIIYDCKVFIVLAPGHAGTRLMVWQKIHLSIRIYPVRNQLLFFYFN